MHRHLKLILFVLLVTLGLWGTLAWHAPIVSAHGSCPAQHTVKRGEYLFSIARQYNTTIWVLLDLNPQLRWHPNLVFAGSQICLPAAQGAFSVVTLEATYKYKPETGGDPKSTDDALMLHNSTWRFGKRVVLPLARSNGVEFIPIQGDEDANKLADYVNQKPAPVLVIKRLEDSPAEARTYAMIEVYSGDAPTILPSLQISTTHALTITGNCNLHTPLQTLEVGRVESVDVTLWLEAENGVRMPFDIKQLGIATRAEICPSDNPALLAMFLRPAPNGKNGAYQLQLRRSGNEIGPEGSDYRWDAYYYPYSWNYAFIWHYWGYPWRYGGY